MYDIEDDIANAKTNVRFAPCVDGSPLARGFPDAAPAGRCGHVFDLLVRQHEPLAIMPSAKTGPDQKHAL